MTKILLVEDDKSLREIYGVRLYAEGYDIVSAGDGEEALAMAIKERPQLIVSDVMMPKISGFDMLDILRSTSETRDIKVIMMTALSSEDQRERGESLGADRYLVKSQVGIEDVVRTVHEVLADTPTAAPAATFPAPGAPMQPRQAAPPQRPTATIPVAPELQMTQSQLQQPQAFAAQPAAQIPATQPFTQPAPIASVAPQAPTAPTAPTPPTPTPQPFTPQQPTAYVTAPPQFVQETTPRQPVAPEPSSLPQPTAPFSTNRPAGLGDKIIHPIEHPTSTADLSHLMDQELGSAPAQPPVAPPAAPAPTPQPPSINFEETPLQRPQQPPQAQ